MTALALLAVALGAGVGAPARYAIDHWVSARTITWIDSPRAWVRLPWGLMAVNIAGSFVLGIVLGATTGTMRYLLAAGLCGTFTTFSSFGWQSYQAWRNDRRVFWLSLTAMTLGCVLAFGLSYSLMISFNA